MTRPQAAERGGAAVAHVVGAGLAGLACALRLAEAGRAVVVHEAAPQAGGRCRSFADAGLGREVDNGSHLVLSGNTALLDYARRIGAAERLDVEPAAFPFLDLRTGRGWTLRPGGLWLLDPARRAPGGGAWAHLAGLRTLAAPPAATVADVLTPDGPLFETLWAPLAVAGLNGPPERVSARLFGAMLRGTLLKGEAACRPVLARRSLADAFVDPAVARLAALGADLRFGARIRAVETAGGRVAALRVGGERLALGESDRVVLALPAWEAARLLPGLTVPPPGAAIVNAHFRLDRPAALPGGGRFLGLVGGVAEWLFARGDVLSVTVSAADRLADRTADEVAAALWADAARALALPSPPPPHRIVKERRATIDQSPESIAPRPGVRTAFANLFLAGDWTDTGLPATLEGAVRSGERAAAAILGR